MEKPEFKTEKMLWFQSSMSKSVNVGNKNNLTRTVKNYADSVVQQASQAVVEGAKLLQDHIVIYPLSYFVSLQPTLHIINPFVLMY